MSITHPSDISGLVLDLDPHEASYTDTGGTTAAGVGDSVARVDDQSGGGYHVTQATGSSQPTLQEDVNGWRHLALDGSNDQMAVEGFPHPSAITVVVVAEATGPGTRDNIVFSADDLADGHRNWQLRQGYPSSGDTPRFLVFSGGSAKSATGASTISGRVVLLGYADGVNVRLEVDGTQVGTGSAGAVDQDPGSLTLGNLDPSGDDSFQGRIYRALIYSKALSSTERTDLYDYLNALYSSAPPGGGGGSIIPHINHYARLRRAG